MQENKLENLIGKRFGRLVVTKKASRLKSNTTRWECICDCGNIIQTTRTSLIRGTSKSCGCYKKEVFSKKFSKYNNYIKKEDYYIGILFNSDDRFIIDSKDFQKIKNYCWHKTSNGYIGTRNKANGKIILLHNLIMSDKYIDHINRNKLDNRRSNLRKVTSQQNSMNKNKQKNNTSGISGVFFDKNRNKWVASLTYNGKSFMKRFTEKNEAIEYRKELERKYFKEFTPIEKLIEEWDK